MTARSRPSHSVQRMATATRSARHLSAHHLQGDDHACEVQAHGRVERLYVVEQARQQLGGRHPGVLVRMGGGPTCHGQSGRGGMQRGRSRGFRGMMTESRHAAGCVFPTRKQLQMPSHGWLRKPEQLPCDRLRPRPCVWSSPGGARRERRPPHIQRTHHIELPARARRPSVTDRLRLGRGIAPVCALLVAALT